MLVNSTGKMENQYVKPLLWELPMPRAPHLWIGRGEPEMSTSHTGHLAQQSAPLGLQHQHPQAPQSDSAPYSTFKCLEAQAGQRLLLSFFPVKCSVWFIYCIVCCLLFLSNVFSFISGKILSSILPPINLILNLTIVITA